MKRRPTPPSRPWQLRMFDVSLKKRQKVALLLRLLGPIVDERCLLLTCGDNNGAMNFHLRAAGGRWAWADMDAGGLDAMAQLLGEPVTHARPDRLPFDDASFDRIVVVDVHEHLADVGRLNREVARVLAVGGIAVVTTPNGDPRLPVARLKRRIGMHPATYGHVVQGYQHAELEDMMRDQGLVPEGAGAYSRFFTELAELTINVAYVKLLSRRNGGSGPEAGEIAPTSEEKLRRVEKSYRVYRAIYPALRVIAALDRILPGDGGYAVAVTARKPG